MRHPNGLLRAALDFVPSRNPTKVAGCQLWMRDNVALNSGNVQTWTDLSPAAAQSFVATTGRPSVTTLARMPALGFNGTTQFLRNTNPESGWMSASEMTIYAVVMTNDAGTNNPTIYQNTGLVCDSGANWGVFLKNGLVFFYGFDGGVKVTSPGVAMSTGVPHILKARHSGGNIFASIDGGAETAGVACGNITLGAVTFIGQDSAGTRLLNGAFGEIALFTSAVSAFDEATNIIDPMKRYWTIP